MEAITYHLEQFDGPLDLLLSLIAKNKVNIADIPISLICDQYMEYISAAQALDMELAAEFLVMASELMLIKSRMLLPRLEAEEEDPRAALADALLQYQRAKAASIKLNERYAQFSGRMAKDTDEITVDRTFVADHEVDLLRRALRHMLAQTKPSGREISHHFTPLIQRPIVPVEVKIIGILGHMQTHGASTLGELLSDNLSRADLIAAFLGILELVKVRRLLIDTQGEESRPIYDLRTRFLLNTDESTILRDQANEFDSAIPDSQSPDSDNERTDDHG
ncbi:MAG: segregation/condensation protein A [Clostridia bacterium]|nr:segregation/condensation protein A [Clostridia bacterium]